MIEKTNLKHTDVSAPQSVTEYIKVQTEKETIQIGFADQKVAPHAGLGAFASFIHQTGFKRVLASALPARTSPNATPAQDLALGFMTGILAGAQNLTQVGYLRSDQQLPQL